MAADVICQSLFEPSSAPFDTRRAMALGTFGAGYMGMFARQHARSAVPNPNPNPNPNPTLTSAVPQLATPAS